MVAVPSRGCATLADAEAAVFVGHGRPIEFRSYPLPTVEPGAILVQVKMASICGTDLHIWHGVRKPPLPIIMGHEAMGVVETLGRGVTKDSGGKPLAEGDRVTWSYVWTCGTCHYCAILKEPASCANRIAYGVGIGCEEPPHLNGGFSEYIYLRPRTTVFKVPASLPDEVIVPVNCALVTMVHVTDEARIRVNENVVVQGTGPLGLFAAILAREKGAGQVIALDASASRLAFAEAFGVDHTVNIAGKSEEDVAKEIKDLTDGIGADLVIEATGVPQAIPAGLKLLREGGRYLTIGPIFQGAVASVDLFNLIFRRLSLIGVARNDAGHLREAIRFLERTYAKYPYDKVVGARYRLAEIEKAFTAVEERRVMRAALIP